MIENYSILARCSHRGAFETRTSSWCSRIWANGYSLPKAEQRPCRLEFRHHLRWFKRRSSQAGLRVHQVDQWIPHWLFDSIRPRPKRRQGCARCPAGQEAGNCPKPLVEAERKDRRHKLENWLPLATITKTRHGRWLLIQPRRGWRRRWKRKADLCRFHCNNQAR